MISHVYGDIAQSGEGFVVIDVRRDRISGECDKTDIE